MTLKIDVKFQEKLIFCFKNDKNLMKFDLSTGNFQNLHFDWFLLSKYTTFDLKKSRGITFHDTKEW